VITRPDANKPNNATGQKNVEGILCVCALYYIAARSRFRCSEERKKKRCKNYDAPQIQGIIFAIFIIFFDIEF